MRYQRLKIMASWISRKALARRRPHHDQVQGRRQKKELDFRVSTVPTLYAKGCHAAAGQGKLRLDMTKLGFEAESLKKIDRNILKPYGWYGYRAKRFGQNEHSLFLGCNAEHGG